MKLVIFLTLGFTPYNSNMFFALKLYHIKNTLALK